MYCQHHPLPTYAREYNIKAAQNVIGNNCLHGITNGSCSINCNFVNDAWKCDIVRCLNGKCDKNTKIFHNNITPNVFDFNKRVVNNKMNVNNP